MYIFAKIIQIPQNRSHTLTKLFLIPEKWNLLDLKIAFAMHKNSQKLCYSDKLLLFLQSRLALLNFKKPRE